MQNRILLSHLFYVSDRSSCSPVTSLRFWVSWSAQNEPIFWNKSTYGTSECTQTRPPDDFGTVRQFIRFYFILGVVLCFMSLERKQKSCKFEIGLPCELWTLSLLSNFRRDACPRTGYYKHLIISARLCTVSFGLTLTLNAKTRLWAYIAKVCKSTLLYALANIVQTLVNSNQKCSPHGVFIN
jgi:hypothetical protein